MPPSRRKIHVLIVIVVALSVQACSPTRPPVDELDIASRALGAARAADAPTWAADEYHAAGEHFDQAQAAEGRQDYDVAAQLARESAADSELAAAKSRLGKVRTAVDKLKQDNANLDSELSQSGTPQVQP
jgi:hypothetical protein